MAHHIVFFTRFLHNSTESITIGYTCTFVWGGSPYDSTRKGERVLIHAATGGVGLVAVQFAQRVGATIFATAGSPGKVQHLRDMGVKYITSSRDAKVS